MKPQLVIGLGNPLMGDDGVGWVVATRLAADPRLPDTAEVICGGTDLLRHAGRMAGRSRVILIDAIQDHAAPGSVIWLQPDDEKLEARQQHAHHLSAVHSVLLLNLITPIPVLLMGISIGSARLSAGLSPALDARMPAILDGVLSELGKMGKAGL